MVVVYSHSITGWEGPDETTRDAAMQARPHLSGIQTGTLFNRLLGIRTFLKAATQRMGAHGVP